jgi:hypothetical protein
MGATPTPQAGVSVDQTANTEGTDTEGTDTEGTETKKNDPITAEEQTWFKEMYGDVGLSAEETKAVLQGWTNSTHADRKAQYDKHKQMIKEAEDKASKDAADKDKKP